MEQIKAIIEKLKDELSLEALKQKLDEFVRKAETVIREQVAKIQREIPVIMKKVEESIKKNIQMVKEQIPILIKKIEKLIKDFFLKSEQFAKRAVEQVTTSEQFIQLIKMLEQLRDLVRDNIEKLLTNPSLVRIQSRVESMIERTVEYTRKTLEVLAKEIPRMTKQVKDLFEFSYTIVMEKYSDVIKAIEDSETYSVVSRAFSEFIRSVQEQLMSLRKWIVARLE